MGVGSNLLPQMLGLLLFLLVADRAVRLLDKDKPAFILLAGVVCLPLVQLTPIPPFLWSLAPGRAEILSTFLTAGVQPPWLPLSLQPAETWRAFFALIPAAGLYLAVRSAGSHQRLVVLLALVGLALVSVTASIVQALGAGAGGVRGAGFFANPNHFVTLLAVCCPLAGALFAFHEKDAPIQPWVVGSGALAALLLGLALSGSRSSLPLGSLAILSVWAMSARPLIADVAKSRIVVAAGALTLIVLLPVAMGMGLVTTVERVQQQTLVEDARWLIASVTWKAIWPYFPFGSGMGTFQAVYQRHEPASALMLELINNAHNDALQIVLEAGLLGLGLLGAWLFFLARATAQAIRREGGRDARIARAAAVGLWLMTLHSLWDYPLRTVALMATAAVLAAVLHPPRDADRPLPAIFGHKRRAPSGRRRAQARTPRAEGSS